LKALEMTFAAKITTGVRIVIRIPMRQPRPLMDVEGCLSPCGDSVGGPAADGPSGAVDIDAPCMTKSGWFS
jgi:hypothetical protein